MSGCQWKYGTNFSSYGTFELKLFNNTFVAFIMKHTVDISQTLIRHISDIYQVYLGPILGIFEVYLRHIYMSIYLYVNSLLKWFQLTPPLITYHYSIRTPRSSQIMQVPACFYSECKLSIGKLVFQCCAMSPPQLLPPSRKYVRCPPLPA